MAIKYFWIGSAGPFFYDTDDVVLNQDRTEAGEALALRTEGQIEVQGSPEDTNHIIRKGDLDNGNFKFKQIVTEAGYDLTIITDDGKTLVLDKSTYDDIPPYPIIGFKPTGAGTDPTLTAFSGNIQQFAFAINDLVDTGTSEVTHKYKEGSDITIHIHWANNGLEVIDTQVNFQVEYVIANPNEAYAGATLTTGNITIPANTADRTHLINGVGTISGTGIKIGAYILFAVSRIARVGGTADPAANPFITAVGFHIEQDTIGSRQLFIK